MWPGPGESPESRLTNQLSATASPRAPCVVSDPFCCSSQSGLALPDLAGLRPPPGRRGRVARRDQRQQWPGPRSERGHAASERGRGLLPVPGQQTRPARTNPDRDPRQQAGGRGWTAPTRPAETASPSASKPAEAASGPASKRTTSEEAASTATERASSPCAQAASAPAHPQAGRDPGHCGQWRQQCPQTRGQWGNLRRHQPHRR